MATPLQLSRQRKITYFIAIIVLFTAAYLHRTYVVRPQALALQLLEEARGEVELTSSTVRLMLTGSRGLATTFLWYQAMDKQKRHEWHEFELLARSITKLQPYFIAPWLYQSWNLTFNVAVECDRPRDKYYYISRGIELLNEGERRNRGVGDANAAADPNKIVFPGHPEIRHDIGFYYQLKLGTSDERLTMRCLLELSCIDPIERNPKRFLDVDQRGREIVKLDEFAKFCHNYPRLVRRLSEQLSYAEPIDIVRFLKDHEKIPNRFKPASANMKESEIKDPLDQFPILPPHEGHWPKPKERVLTDESMDVFLVCRTWYEFAQKPLPPPDPAPMENERPYDKQRFRMPKKMVTQLFRQYPARAQVYIAETLEAEGFFDSDGWDIPNWFDSIANRQDGDDSVVGKDLKYHSRFAWQRGFDAYRDFGIKNGIYLTEEKTKELNDQAALFRKVANVPPGTPMQQPRPEWRVGEIGASMDAHVRLRMSDYFRQLTNFNSFFYQAEGERDPITVSARKLLFYAERMRKRQAATELMLREYERAWPFYELACLKYPHFAQVSSMQEEFYEFYQHYLGETQRVHSEVFKRKAIQYAKLPFGPVPTEDVDLSKDQIEMLVAKLAAFPQPNAFEALARYVAVSAKERDQQFMNGVAKMKQRTGALDSVQYYDGPAANDLRDFLFLWTQGASLAMNESVASTFSIPGHNYFLLTRRVNDIDAAPPTHWRPLITAETRRITANRLGLDR